MKLIINNSMEDNVAGLCVELMSDELYYKR